ncbi:hypothetical protein Micbo1qcDRAFT_224684 [Microdochium bolleyi]|uniref:Zn(2)-C6 fungal-type domain-containing protein n=1 Tax=Microdochium bolleyi TaxID=196109 RepID=A0A136IJH4_9PEZI|nr:hypothetical protein Micbo1qcDRAFT_224684 [Microdochium bolleyi]
MNDRSRPSPATKACLACREKHLKCGGQSPVCQRCREGGLICTYVESRRGRRAAPTRPAAATMTPTVTAQSPFPVGFDLSGQLDLREQALAVPGAMMPQAARLQQPAVASNRDTASTEERKLIGLYNQDEGVFPRHLKHAMCFVASHHATMSATEKQRFSNASNAIFAPGVPQDAYKVQTLVLLTLAAYARFEREQGAQALNAAISQDHDPLLRESWRRTWWELYTVTGLISLVSGTHTRLSQPKRRVLPGNCNAYNASTPSSTPHMDVRDMRRRFRAEEAAACSSFAYKVEAMRILSRVLDTPIQLQNDSSSAGSQAAEAAVASFLLSLPDDKREALKADGEVDEVMSCALMIIHLASVCVHLPLSPLAYVGDFRTVCGNHLGQAATVSPKSHQVAAIKSANAIARLLTVHGGNLTTLSPCFSCALAFSSAVLLAAYSLDARDERPPILEENLNLELSALRSLGQIWPVAVVIRGQIAQFARDVIGTSQDKDTTSTGGLEQLTPPLDDQWLRDLLGDVDMLPDSPDFDIVMP